MCKIIFIGNYKGGVGKTTTVLNIAKYFSKAKKKVLTLDLDPQSSLSEIQSTNFGKKLLSDLSDYETLNYIFDLYINKIKKYPNLKLEFSSDMIKKVDDYYDYIPTSLFYSGGKGLDSLSIEMSESIEYLSILKEYIDAIKGSYDYILIDCPPSSNLMTQSAFLMSDFYLIPTVLDEISTNGVIHYISTVRGTYKRYCDDSEDSILYRHYFGKAPVLIGIFYNLIRGQVDYGQVNGTFKKSLEKFDDKEKIKTHIFEAKINNYVDIARSAEKGEISKYKSDFKDFSKELLERIEELSGEN